MKVRIGDYPHRNRLTCHIYGSHMKKKYGNELYGAKVDYEDHIAEAVSDSVQYMYDIINTIWFDKLEQKVAVRIDPWDTYSMDLTLTPIILPMLKQLKVSKHGVPNVDDCDVPEELRDDAKDIEAFTRDGTPGDKYQHRWNWVLDEMIWSFDQKTRPDWQSEYTVYNDMGKGESVLDVDLYVTGVKTHQDRMSNGFRLFGVYFESLWN
jgi:hypothetical protein